MMLVNDRINQIFSDIVSVDRNTAHVYLPDDTYEWSKSMVVDGYEWVVLKIGDGYLPFCIGLWEEQHASPDC